MIVVVMMVMGTDLNKGRMLEMSASESSFYDG